jgi:hypothetical protein
MMDTAPCVLKYEVEMVNQRFVGKQWGAAALRFGSALGWSRPALHHRKHMAPIRRYLRISKYSILECRIYLENPGLADTWLLNPRDPVLPRVFESVRPLVLPKLREENERAKGKGKKASRGIKDVIVQGMRTGSHPASKPF